MLSIKNVSRDDAYEFKLIFPEVIFEYISSYDELILQNRYDETKWLEYLDIREKYHIPIEVFMTKEILGILQADSHGYSTIYDSYSVFVRIVTTDIVNTLYYVKFSSYENAMKFRLSI